jgi:Ca2+-binding RTX toxin-like protein
MVVLLASAVVATVTLGLPASSAHAGGVKLVGSEVTFSASPGEANNITVTLEKVPHVFTTTDYFFVISDGIGIDDFDFNQPWEHCRTLTGLAECPASPGTLLTIFADDGDDHVTVDDSVVGPVRICGEAGNDTLIGGSGGDRIAGGSGSDHIEGNAGSDLIWGTQDPSGRLLRCPSDNQALDSLGGDSLLGGSGQDSLVGASGPDTLLGGEGDDGLYGAVGNDSLDGGSGEDNIGGGAGDDSLNGGPGIDQLTGGPGSDTELGGDGNDELGTSWVLGPDLVERDDGDDAMDGGPGDDVLNGGPGELTVTTFPTSLKDVTEGDEVPSPNGSDLMQGGEGRDTVTYVKRSTPVTLSLDGERNDGASGEQDRIGSDVEIVVGGSADDTLDGSALADDIDGGPGSDTINGGAGDDLLSGGRGDEGSDQIVGGEGNDTVLGINGRDRLFGGNGSDTVSGGGGPDQLDGGPGDDRMTGGPGGDLVAGGTGNDTLNGGDQLGADGPDDLRGEAGNDTLDGGEGNDLLAGGPGADRMRGDAGDDIADYSSATAAVTISLDGKANDGEDGERDDLAADIESARGGNGKDSLFGDQRANQLSGSAGDDFIEGGSGADTLEGNDGNDAINSRDSLRDLVSCGRGFDVAIVDDQDRVRDNCELVDRGGADTATLGRFFTATLVRGSVRLRPRSMDRFIPLVGATKLAVRSLIDARNGTVALSMRSAGRHFRSSVLRGSMFTVDQRPSRSPLADLRLRGGNLSACRSGRRAADGSRAGRKLVVRTTGRLRVVGRYGSVRGRNATWSITDRCSGTLVRVRHGRVRVFDSSRGRTFKLSAGEAYLAKR